MTPSAGGVGESRGIVLAWLVRLRWLAVSGQAVTVAFAGSAFGTRYPLIPLGVVLAVTVVTNVLLLPWAGRRREAAPAWAAPGVLALDVLLLTTLLYFTGGPDNPFWILFVVHVAMATVVLGPGPAWGVVATAAACFALLVWRSRPITAGDQPLPGWALPVGQWVALVLVSGLLAYFIGRVIFALRTREAELAAVRERAVLSERLASLTTLAAGAAHELGTPLGTIALVAKEMEIAARAGGDAPVADDAALVRQQVERCRQILDHMRGDVAGRSTDDPGTCDVDEVLAGVRAAPGPGRAARLRVRSLPPDATVAAPCRAVQQAVQLLVSNAFDASPGDAEVVIDVTAGPGGTAFHVADRGSGMDADTLRRATEPFFTTKDPGRGMGLGLFLVRLIADRHGGSITLSSTPGVGTQATFTLPGAQAGDSDRRDEFISSPDRARAEGPNHRVPFPHPDETLAG